MYVAIVAVYKSGSKVVWGSLCYLFPVGLGLGFRDCRLSLSQNPSEYSIRDLNLCRFGSLLEEGP